MKTPINKTPEQGEFIEYQQNFERLFKSALGTLVHQYYEQELFTPSIQNIRNRLIEIGTYLKILTLVGVYYQTAREH
ncbi:hypothetical protein BSPWISOXPB_8865 [uncultured Gammaproteobacteria bacterium]|nr:hypothetical protein BSPWISOXPB_8865 [uncultured Gammaproteobacteria bacterium]